jgi:nucleotide-binding universal stress UspA family protein
MKKILFPTDFSESAEEAFRYAIQMAKALDARVDMTTIYHLPISEASRVHPDQIERMLIEKKQKVEEKLERLAAKAPAERRGALRAEYGLFVAEEIADSARAHHCDLIIMGAKGARNSIEKILGSVTTQTMMCAPCPVLAVPKDVEFQPINDIAYATDFMPSDEPAVHSLLDLAGMLGASVHFVHVDTKVEIGERNTSIELEKYPFPFTDFTVINNPSVLEGIDEYLRRKNIDLLALFIPRRRLWERLFHSSFTKKMAFHTKIPLLVFRKSD